MPVSDHGSLRWMTARSDALYDGPGGLAGLGGAWGELTAYSAVATRSAGASTLTVGVARTSEALEPTTMSLLL